MKLLNKTVWAITPEMMQTMTEIAKETRRTPEAVAKEFSKDNANNGTFYVKDNIAVIRVSGPLFRYANLMTRICGATSYEILTNNFNVVLQDTKIKAVLFDFDSPGGEVNGCSELADLIYNARGQKPIVAYASGSCCSGAYWIASACDKIWAADTAILGSIGVVSVFENDGETKTIEIVSSQSPNKRPDISTDKGKAQIQARVDDLADVFIAKVARNRGISENAVVKNFGAGGVSVGENAVRNGLADGLSSFEEIFSDLNQTTEISFMNEEKQKAAVVVTVPSAADIKAAERQRMTDVLSSDKAKGKEMTAQMLLSKTDLAAGVILDILQTVPAANDNFLDKAMASIKNPEIQPAAETEDDNAETMAKRIASFMQEDK